MVLQNYPQNVIELGLPTPIEQLLRARKITTVDNLLNAYFEGQLIYPSHIGVPASLAIGGVASKLKLMQNSKHSEVNKADLGLQIQDEISNIRIHPELYLFELKKTINIETLIQHPEHFTDDELIAIYQAILSSSTLDDELNTFLKLLPKVEQSIFLARYIPKPVPLYILSAELDLPVFTIQKITQYLPQRFLNTVGTNFQLIRTRTALTLARDNADLDCHNWRDKLTELQLLNEQSSSNFDLIFALTKLILEGKNPLLNVPDNIRFSIRRYGKNIRQKGNIEKSRKPFDVLLSKKRRLSLLKTIDSIGAFHIDQAHSFLQHNQLNIEDEELKQFLKVHFQEVDNSGWYIAIQPVFVTNNLSNFHTNLLKLLQHCGNQNINTIIDCLQPRLKAYTFATLNKETLEKILSAYHYENIFASYWGASNKFPLIALTSAEEALFNFLSKHPYSRRSEIISGLRHTTLSIQQINQALKESFLIQLNNDRRYSLRINKN